MRRSRASLILTLAIAAVTATATIAFAATSNVGVKKSGSKYLWTPSSLNIKKGDTVKWSWSGKVPHNVTGKGFKSATKNKLTFTHTFTKAGTYTVVCTIHQALGQKMTIKVR
jgi:plastocyanin